MSCKTGLKILKQLISKRIVKVLAFLKNIFLNQNSFKDGDHHLEGEFPFQSQFDSDRSSSGWKSQKKYKFWSQRACGIACVRMIIKSKKQAALTMAELAKRAQQLGGYKLYDQKGNFIDKGWYYKALLKVLADFGFLGNVNKVLPTNQIARKIKKGCFAVVSVNNQVLNNKKVAFFNFSNHLVLVTGFRAKNGKVVGFYLHNPYDTTRKSQKGNFVDIALFKKAFGYRGFYCWPISSRNKASNSGKEHSAKPAKQEFLIHGKHLPSFLK